MASLCFFDPFNAEIKRGDCGWIWPSNARLHFLPEKFAL